MTFAPCDKKSCVNISTILDGCVVEKDKNFTVSLVMFQPQDDRIRLGSDSGVVTIKDNDGKKLLLKIMHLLHLLFFIKSGLHTLPGWKCCGTCKGKCRSSKSVLSSD